MDPAYLLRHAVPSAAEYCRLREAAGLSPRSLRAAEAALPLSAVAATVRRDGALVAMGRIVGDGLFYLVVDIAVDPGHQRRGLGTAVMDALMRRLAAVAPAEAHVSLLADEGAPALYARFGFRPTAPASVGMARWINRTSD